MVDNLTNYGEAILITKECVAIIRYQVVKEKHINCSVCTRLHFFPFSESNKFMEMVMELGISKSRIYFKINLTNILDKYSKLKSRCNNFKYYAKAIKEICKESGTEFKQFILQYFGFYYHFEFWKKVCLKPQGKDF